MNYCLGIDTSCYTTSAAVVDFDGTVVADERRILRIPLGERGLQQSRSVSQHLDNLAPLLADLFAKINPKKIACIAASTRPRPVAGSFMPVFLVGANHGRALASVLQVPFFASSHQEGHIEAGLFSSGLDVKGKFLAVHLSGGTSELLEIAAVDSGRFRIRKLGGTLDLYAGQFVDRVGVRLGMEFPAGPGLERLARTSAGNCIPIPSSVTGYDFSFSGPESQAQRLIDGGHAGAEVARGVEQCIAKTVEKIVRAAVAQSGLHHVLLVGGVAANQYVRERLRRRLEHQAVGATLHFAHSRLSSDNAVGIAFIGQKLLAGNRG